MAKSEVKVSSLPSYLRPLYSFPEERRSRSNLPGLEIPKVEISPMKSYNQKTSYANSFSQNKGTYLSSTAKKILTDSNDFSSSPEFSIRHAKNKSLVKMGDIVTAQALSNVNRLSPSKLNFAMQIKPEHFEKLEGNIFHQGVSGNNSSWISQQNKKVFAEKFTSGEYIPSITQMDLYGKKQQKSKFEAHELWR